MLTYIQKAVRLHWEQEQFLSMVHCTLADERVADFLGEVREGGVSFCFEDLVTCHEKRLKEV